MVLLLNAEMHQEIHTMKLAVLPFVSLVNVMHATLTFYLARTFEKVNFKKLFLSNDIIFIILYTDQPTNLTVVDGTWISWIGSVCAGTDTTYRVVVTFVSDSQPTCTCTRDPIETSNTTTVLSGLLPNQQYSVSVSAYGTSCVSDPATVNFTSPAHHSTTTECKCSSSNHDSCYIDTFGYANKIKI